MKIIYNNTTKEIGVDIKPLEVDKGNLKKVGLLMYYEGFPKDYHNYSLTTWNHLSNATVYVLTTKEYYNNWKSKWGYIVLFASEQRKRPGLLPSTSKGFCCHLEPIRSNLKPLKSNLDQLQFHWIQEWHTPCLHLPRF